MLHRDSTIVNGSSRRKLGTRWTRMMSIDSEDVRPFSSRGSYQTVYDIIQELPFYRRAMALHMQWIRSIKTSHPLIVDAGGGTGIMTAEARRLRHDADVYLVDINPAMAAQAANRGVPKDKIVITDITDMSIERLIVSQQHLEPVFSESSTQPGRLRVKSEGIDHIFSHSVIWALPRPEAFFAEAQRVLKPGGTLAVSTVGENLHTHRQYFIDYLEKHLSAAVRHGTVSPEQKRTFVEQNRGITDAAKSPLSVKQLVEFGERHRFEVEAVADCYVLDTPQGPRSYFHQVLYRRT